MVKQGVNVAGAVSTGKAMSVYADAARALRRLDDGELTPEDARARAALMSRQVAQVRLELDHAKLSHRIKEGSPELPGFLRTDPK